MYSSMYHTYNFDDWRNGYNNILYVVGMSGSGKSTLSKKYAEQYNCEHIDLDKMENILYLCEGNSLSDKQLENTPPSMLDFYSKYGDKLLNLDDVSLFNKFIKFMQRSEKHCIIEGLQLSWLINEYKISKEDIKKSSWYIIDSSYQRCLKNRLKRNPVQIPEIYLKEWWEDYIKSKNRIDRCFKDKQVDF